MQYSIFYTVISSETAANYSSDTVATQVFNNTGRKFVAQVMIASTVRMFINFNTFENLEVISSRIKTGNEVEAFSTDDGMCRPTDV